MRKPIHRLAAGLIFILGIFLRVQHLFHIDAAREPFRLGGLFIAFAAEIIRAGFRLPVTIPFYSAGGIPFAYPPLAFYVEALFLAFFPRSAILIANLLPPLTACLTLTMSYFLLWRVFPRQPAHVLAGFFACAFLPNALTNQIEAAGLAEAFGSLMLVSYFWAALRFRAAPSWQTALLSGLTLGLCILTSPGSALGAALLSVLLGAEHLLRQRFDGRALARIALMAVSGALLSAPYWAVVMSRHGRGIFLLPVLAQYQISAPKSALASLIELTSFQISADGWAFAWNLVIILGLLRLMAQKQFALPLALLALFSIPRENTWLTALPAALLFAVGLQEVLVPLLAQSPQSATPTFSRHARNFISVVLAGWAIFISFALLASLEHDQQWRLTTAQAERLTEARALIPAHAQVIALGNDALLEWAPYLLEREVLNTKFGLEWQPEEARQVAELNQRLETARSWDEIAAALPASNAPIYILSTDKKLLTAYARASQYPFTLKLETAELQVVRLGPP